MSEHGCRVTTPGPWARNSAPSGSSRAFPSTGSSRSPRDAGRRWWSAPTSEATVPSPSRSCRNSPTSTAYHHRTAPRRGSDRRGGRTAAEARPRPRASRRVRGRRGRAPRPLCRDHPGPARRLQRQGPLGPAGGHAHARRDLRRAAERSRRPAGRVGRLNADAAEPSPTTRAEPGRPHRGPAADGPAVRAVSCQRPARGVDRGRRMSGHRVRGGPGRPGQQGRLELEQPRQHAVDERRRLFAGQLLGEAYGLADATASGTSSAYRSSIGPEPQDVAVDRRHPVESPALGVRRPGARRGARRCSSTPSTSVTV